MKKYVLFSLTSPGTNKYECVMNTKEISSFQPPIINSENTG